MALPAGLGEGAVSLRRVNPKRDRNEAAIYRSLSMLPGCVVYRINGPGIPDLLVGYYRRWVLLEVKTVKGRLEPLQVAFHGTATALRLPCMVVRTVDEALQALGEKP
jgi:hypothetical protein